MTEIINYLSINGVMAVGNLYDPRSPITTIYAMPVSAAEAQEHADAIDEIRIKKSNTGRV